METPSHSSRCSRYRKPLQTLPNPTQLHLKPLLQTSIRPLIVSDSFPISKTRAHCILSQSPANAKKALLRSELADLRTEVAYLLIPLRFRAKLRSRARWSVAVMLRSGVRQMERSVCYPVFSTQCGYRKLLYIVRASESVRTVSGGLG